MKALALLLLVGCTTSPIGLDGMPETPFRPTVEDPTQLDAVYYRALVGDAMKRWNTGLTQYGCSPLRLADDTEPAYPIKLFVYNSPSWQWGPTFVGMTVDGNLDNGGRIDTMDRDGGTRGLNNLPVILHELGHAMGLEHDDVTPGSIMRTHVGNIITPNATDFVNAAESLGCPGAP